MVRRTLLLIFAVSIATVTLAQAGGDAPPATTETEPPVTEPAVTEPAPPVLPVVIPDGVSISGVFVGGMMADQAALAVRTVFDEPLKFRHGRKRWTVRPDLLGAKAYVEGAVRRALRAVPGSNVDLVITVKGQVVRNYVASLDRDFSRAVKNSEVRLVNLRPRISKPAVGYAVLSDPMTAAILRALRSGDRAQLKLLGRVLKPKVTLRNFGPVIVIRRGSKQLYLYRGQRYWTRFGVATGQDAYPTPLGRFAIQVMWRDPWWYPPASDWAQGQEPIPPGPGNPLGTRWMGLTAPLVGIHGTPDPASIGYSASHGCIRMLIPEAEWLFNHVKIGTTVFIVPA
jgi:hypothetical protein